MADTHGGPDIPDSFLALFRERAGARLSQPWHHVAERHEFCEDLCRLLAPGARAHMLEQGITAQDMAPRMIQALVHPSVGLAPEEASWVERRLEELLDAPSLL